MVELSRNVCIDKFYGITTLIDIGATEVNTNCAFEEQESNEIQQMNRQIESLTKENRRLLVENAALKTFTLWNLKTKVFHLFLDLA